MGCSQSTNTLQGSKKNEKLQPFAQNPTIKKREEGPHFLIGNIKEQQYFFGRVNLINKSINKLSVPQGFKPYNFSSMIKLDNKEFFISGGINFKLTDITSDTWIYDPSSHQVRAIAKMNQPRYTHAAFLFNGCVYAIGGRYFGEDEYAILRSCERYSLQRKEWKVGADLNVKRCTCYAIEWRKSLYVFGGYTGTFQRSQKIEKLNQKQNIWEILDFTLNRGIQSAFLLPTGSNQITIFGGNTNSGPTASVSTINLDQRTILSHKHLMEKKTLHKSFVMDQQVYIFGGSDKLFLQIYNISDNKSESFDLKISQQFSPEVFEVLTISQDNVILSSNQQKHRLAQIDAKDQIILMFGTTQEPFILEINVSIPSSNMHSVPLSLKLYANSGGVNLSNLTYILFGGIQDDSLSYISSQTFLYNHITKEAKQLANMSTPRYSFSYQRIEDRIYVAGGGNSDVDGSLEILSECQFYQIKSNSWKSICNLPKQLISSMSLNYKGNLYVFGGVGISKERSKAIFKYNEIEDRWIELAYHLPFGIQSAVIYSYKPHEFYIFGGRLDNGDSDAIWNLIFVQNSHSECSLIQKGATVEKRSGLKVFKPESQSFLVALGGNKQLVSYYDVETLKVMQWDGLRHLKNVFLSQVITLNSQTMENYLTINKFS